MSDHAFWRCPDCGTNYPLDLMGPDLYGSLGLLCWPCELQAMLDQNPSCLCGLPADETELVYRHREECRLRELLWLRNVVLKRGERWPA